MSGPCPICGKNRILVQHDDATGHVCFSCRRCIRLNLELPEHPERTE